MNIKQIEKSISLSPKLREDPTAENYIALFHAITDKDIDYYSNKVINSRKYLKGLFDDEEGDKRIAEIDYLRKLGAGTEIEHEIWLEKFKKKAESKRNYVGARKIKVTNPYAGTEEIYPSINQMCEEYDFKKKNVRSMFHYKKSNKIQYKGLILEKL